MQLQSTDSTAFSERLNWLHSLIQELENNNTELPMGDYSDVYKIIEDAREALFYDPDPTPPDGIEQPIPLIQVLSEENYPRKKSRCGKAVYELDEGLCLAGECQECDEYVRESARQAVNNYNTRRLAK